MKKILLITSFLCLLIVSVRSQDEILVADKGLTSFKSDAPLEIIKAECRSLRGVINPATKSFAFTVNISSFQGFNSDIQRVHFLENYMEQKKYPQASFTGKIIEDIPFDVPGTYTVRAKGDLEIHGIKKERIIKGTLVVTSNGAHVQTNFTIPVAEHGIAIPKIVKQKIAEEILVTVDIDFVQGPKS